MSDLEKDQYNRYRRAGQLIASYLEAPSTEFLRKAEAAGVLDEAEFLLEETRVWLDDDDYYDDLAWNKVNGNL